MLPLFGTCETTSVVLCPVRGSSYNRDMEIPEQIPERPQIWLSAVAERPRELCSAWREDEGETVLPDTEETVRCFLEMHSNKTGGNRHKVER